MSKYILGIHNGFESSVCLIKNGEILEAISEERFNFIKVYAGKPKKALDYLFNKYNFLPKDIEFVIYSRVTFKNNWGVYVYKLIKRLIRSIIRNPLLISVFIRRIKTEFRDRVFRKDFLNWMESIGIKNNKIIFLDHHQAHAWSAYSCSPFNDAIVLTADGRGDLKSTTISVADREKGVREIDYLLTFDSLGFLYAQVTNYLGFKPHRHEGKVTGLAAFGNPEKTLPIFKKMVSWDIFSGQWITNLNLYAPHKINNLNSFKKILNPFSKEDIAAGVQKHCENLIISYVKHWLKKLGKDSLQNICLAGGLFANVKINQCISEIEGIKNIFVFPNMGDGGLTVGGACYQNFINNKKPKVDFPTVYLGNQYEEDEILKILQLSKNKIIFKKMKNRPNEISEILEDGKVVGYFDGRMEFGPRSLGSRSILVNAKDKSINKSLNKRLERTEFMPFAPVTPENYAAECYIDWNPEHIASHFMTRTYKCQSTFIKKHPAVVHVDGTARPQIIKREHNQRYYDVIKTYCDRNNERALINTSFNVHEQPIIISPDLAVRGLLQNRIDILILSDYIIHRNQ